MGSDQSSPETRYRKELLKLSWRLVLAVEEASAKPSSKSQSNDGDEKTPINKGSPGETSKDGSLATVQIIQGKDIRPFHEDFEKQFFNYCPDLRAKFPKVEKLKNISSFCIVVAKDYSLVARMIRQFVTNAISANAIPALARRFAKSHKKYELKQEHFEGFAEALVDTIQVRLGKFGTIELIKIWREVTQDMIKVSPVLVPNVVHNFADFVMRKELKKAQGQS